MTGWVASKQKFCGVIVSISKSYIYKRRKSAGKREWEYE